MFHHLASLPSCFYQIPISPGRISPVQRGAYPGARYRAAVKEFVTPTSAMAAKEEAVAVEDMDMGLDYWLPCDKLQN